MGKRFMRLKQMMRLGKPAAVPAADSSAVSAKSLLAIPSTSLEVVTVEITNGTEEVLAAEEASASPPPGCPYHKSSSTAESTPPPECPYHHQMTGSATASAAAPAATTPAATTPAPPAPPPQTSPPTAWPRAEPNAKVKKLAFARVQASVDELLATHAAAVATLRAAVADDAHFATGGTAKTPYDDLWLLRFILSNGAKEAEKAVRATLKYRADNAAMLALAAEGQEHPQKEAMCQLSISEIWRHPTLADEPVQLIRAGKSNVKRLMDTYSADDVVQYMNFQKEQAFLLCDEATRRTRRIVKMVTVVDMHSSRFADNDNRFFKALGRASKDSELFYPQLLAITVGINVPSYLNLIWPIAKRLMPAKTLSKFRICSARDTVTQSAAQCPFA
jgi:hypothetical protein